ncbi:hypothetical protein STRAU_4882 [Streptomyces aurantiacus JA 4570]|uniref:Uncharacterized protein n=1 Tax=Streptomyces aurantiacus JA 4570 TaxID=1286094 RepID=S3ZEI8_9ACTN|nr:hypothetical protein STRAU_4882 [Streptomyces aurantiacus JA 4570]
MPTLGRSVASAAATTAGNGAGMPRWSGTRSSSALRHFARHSSPAEGVIMLTPNRNGLVMNSPQVSSS